MSTTANYTSAAKPRAAGSIYRAPKGTTLPTSADSVLDTAVFTCLGYIGEDGITNSNSRESEALKAWGGDTVLTIQTDYTDTFNFKLIEVLNKDVLGTVYGENNVTGTDLASGISVSANSQEPTAFSWVIDMIMNDDTLNRIVIPDGKISEMGDTSYSTSELVAYDVTVTAFPDSSNNTHYEYKKKNPVVTG